MRDDSHVIDSEAHCMPTCIKKKDNVLERNEERDREKWRERGREKERDGVRTREREVSPSLY